ncbi:MAG: SusF/SusE family outer membrane protein [Bacteroidales bacterium]|nr:SusF/SusE family outer membrane protein [Bacteroidales bacterium]
MKKLKNILMLLACLTLCWACERDGELPTASTPESFVLNTPVYTAGIYDLKNAGSVQLTCTPPDYGFTAITTYKVQVALKNTFAAEEFVTLPTSYMTAKMNVSATEIAVALVGLLGIEDEAAFPTDTILATYIRLSAELADGSHTVLSNAIELPKVKCYFALPPVVMPNNIYLAGNINEWKWDAATVMVPVHGTEGKFWAVQYLGKAGNDNAEIRFNTAKGEDLGGASISMENAVIDDDSKTLADIAAGSNNAITIGNPGWYIVVVTTEISGRNYTFNVQFLEPKVYLFGRAMGGLGVWGAGTDNLFTVPDISLGADADFVSPAFIGAPAGGSDGVRACIVLSGHEWWNTEFMVFDSKLVYRAKGGDQEPRVPGTIGQKLYINFTKGTGKIE